MDNQDTTRRRGRGSQKVTIKEVADAAGVSMMTVSNVIHDRANVGTELRAYVQSKIQELGYTPNRAAQQLAGVARPHVGLIYTGVTNPFIASVIVGTMKAASRLQVDVSVELAKLDDPKALRNTMLRMEETGIDGFLLPSPIAEFVGSTFKKKALDVPAVAIAPGFPIQGMASVRADERKASLELVSMLVELGHRKIGHLAGPESQSGSMARLQGYKDALTEHGLEPRPEWVVPTVFNFQEGVKAAERLLAQEPGLTAIFAANDTLAASVLAVAHNRGINVPDQLSVVGYDDSPVAEQAWPGLTTIHQDALEMTERAVELLADAVRRWKTNRDGHVNQDVVFPYRMVTRGSVAKAP
ncbi:LacI family DNA-binding transcriptional regulator [Rhizobium sp. AG207R]|uniref:LacI family DNA-binding transcriptional regulator n=1 Tax=Rhizobium sp. AG207R TaxID=2802287 RepID=UPI0022ABF8DB|nr:LacI family DNA-binding transcriptional regulator [Rhizobium sp. AG207R]MCZ3374331.1 LacI family DNA-binding transcriptional regulator [Rhizobium sp. AG207R]